MNLAEFNTELGKLVNRAMKEGVAARKLTPVEIIGSLEFQKAEIIRHFQDLARANQQPQIIPFRGPLPPPGS